MSTNTNPALSFSELLSLLRSEGSRSFFNRLKQELTRMNALVSEANTIASEMQRQTTYTVMLQIPVSYLKPSERVRREEILGLDMREFPLGNDEFV